MSSSNLAESTPNLNMGCLCDHSNSLEPRELPIKRRVTYDALTITPSLYVQENQDKFSTVYSLLRPLGKGIYSSVFQCQHKRTGQVRAVKVINKSEVDKELLESGSIMSEVQIHKALDHPNIVRLYEFFEDEQHFYFVQEYCAAGELFDIIISKRRLSEKEAALIMEQLASAVAYLHSRNIIHRDIKPENILLTEDGQLKLIDFDAAVLMDVRRQVTGSVGTAYYIAPEVLNGSYNEKCDVWSMGVVMYILLTGNPPFSGHSGREIVQQVLKGQYSLEGPEWLHISASAKDLISKMMVRNPHKRISAQGAYLHQWIITEKSRLTQNDRSMMLDNLNRFHSTTKLKDALHTFICTQILASNELSRLTSLFKACDRDGDGVLSRDDLMPQFTPEMPQEAAAKLVDEIMLRVDTDNNGFIEYTEFVKASIDRKVLLSKKNLQVAFSLFDKEGAGIIGVQELRDWMANGTLEDDERWVKLLSDVGVQDDGVIDLKHFEKLIALDSPDTLLA